LALLIGSQFVFGQMKQGLKAYEEKKWVEALNYFKKAEEKKDDANKAVPKIAACYYMMGNYPKALEYYDKASEESLNSMDLMYYASLKMFNEQYDAALDLISKSQTQANKDPLLAIYKSSCEWAKKNSSPKDYQISPTELTFGGKSLGIQYFKDGLVFPANINNKTDAKGVPVMDLYFAAIVAGKITAPNILSAGLASADPKGGASISKDGKFMYFTKYEKAKDGRYLGKIYEATNDGKDWKIGKGMPFNSLDNIYSCATPFVTPDGNTLFFSSDIIGGAGRFDLFVSYKKDGSWGPPNNLRTINTPGDELFPFVDSKGNLFFSTDGRNGFGGLDIFVSYTSGGSNFNMPINLGKPLNSAQHDFSCIFNSQNEKEGFVISSRSGAEMVYKINYTGQLASNVTNTEISNEVIDVENVEDIEEEGGISCKEKYFAERERQLLKKFNANSVSTIAKDKQKQFNDELYAEEKYYSQKMKDDLKAQNVTSIKQLPKDKQDKFYCQLYEEQFTSSASYKTDDPEWDLTDRKGVTYKVQFLSSRKPLDNLPAIDGNFSFRYFHKGLYRYTVGNYPDVPDADKLKQKCVAAGYKDAFVVAFKNNERIFITIYKK